MSFHLHLGPVTWTPGRVSPETGRAVGVFVIVGIAFAMTVQYWYVVIPLVILGVLVRRHLDAKRARARISESLEAPFAPEDDEDDDQPMRRTPAFYSNRR